MIPRTDGYFEENFPGSSFSEDEVEFMMAMERYKRKHRRPFPTCHEVLAVLKSLGYRKVPPEEGDQST
ncbi:MAG TPA: hypothetical protein VKS79_16365 [Gemmataceae bacterium]|nr:hypothetical protein [Gemmataceae bacterium]